MLAKLSRLTFTTCTPRKILSRSIRCSGHMTSYGMMRNVCRFDKEIRNRRHGRLRRRLENSFEIYLQEIGYLPGQERPQRRTLVNTLVNFQLPQNAGEVLTKKAIFSLSWRTALHSVSEMTTIVLTVKQSKIIKNCSSSLISLGTVQDFGQRLYFQPTEFLSKLI
jgi:hypothetical protein